MYTASTASPLDQDSILSFLERRGFVYDPWLAWSVGDALTASDNCVRLVVCKRRRQVTGVASVSWNPEKGIEAGCQIRIDAAETDAAAALVEEFPVGAPGSVWVFEPVVRDYFASLPDVPRSDGDPYFTVEPQQFRPVEGEPVLELTAGDGGLFEGCERQQDMDYIRHGNRIYAIVRDGRAATSVGYGCVGPVFPSGRRVIAISGLQTETRYRRQGLAKRLVSHVTATILGEGHVPIYWTESDNVASLALCKGLGYRQYAQVARFAWAKS